MATYFIEENGTKSLAPVKQFAITSNIVACSKLYTDAQWT